jgi:hypothetical protein
MSAAALVRAFVCHASMVTALAVVAVGFSDSAQAHAFGARYELPVPVWLFVVGGAVTVTLTFVLVALFVRTGPERYANARLALPAPVDCALRHPLMVGIAKIAAVALLMLVILAGIVGDQNPNKNIVPTFVWVIWWVGFSYLAMLIGNPWPILNPWRTLFELFSDKSRPTMRRPYPKQTGAWPAVALLLVIAWTEQILPNGAVPRTIVIIAFGYSILIWIGMRRYGPDAWLSNADPVSLVFDVYARFAPVTPNLQLRPYAAGLLGREDDTVSTSMTAFILAMLSTVMFDGLLGSAHWVELENMIHAINPKLSDLGWIAVHTLGLVAMWGVFLGLYFATCWSMSLLCGGTIGGMDIARYFALTLVPIVIGYHFAHTFSYLLVQGQQIVAPISDPFNLGWNLFGTRDFKPEISIMTTKTAWYLAVSAIVVGHVVSVYLAHVAAERCVKDRRLVLRCLVPMTVLMVLYTITSLLILAEPLVRYSGPNNEIM